MPSYVTASDLLARFDERDIQQCVVDDSSDWKTVVVTSHPYVEIALDDAEGEVVASLRKAGKYDAAALAALTGVDLARLKRIICEIAMVHLLRRRSTFNPDTLKFYEDIRKGHLKDLQDGNSVLTSDEPAIIEAGIVSNEGPTTAQWQDLNLWRDETRYFPRRKHP